jgi:hypothetical protein
MLKKFSVFTLLIFALGIGAATASAQEWVKLGDREVKDRSEQDTWHVGKGEGEFHRIKIKVHDRAVRFYRLLVTFENGTTQEVPLRNVIPAGGESRAIDLTGNERYIDKVDVWYEAQTYKNGRRSHVTLWGIR